MKIAIITMKISSGGSQRVIVQLLNDWVDRNECLLILLDDAEDFYKIDDRVNIHRIGKVSENSVLDKFARYRYMRRLIIKEKPDIILSLPEEIGIYVIGAMLGSKFPVVVSERNNPWIMPYKRITRILRKVLYPYCSGFIFQTEKAALFFSKRIQERGIILPNPLDLNRLPQIYEGEREKIIVSVGRFEKQKNFQLLIDAFRIVNKNNPEYKLVIYGEGSLRTYLNNYALEFLPKGSWEFPGRDDNVLEKIKKSTCFVLSSDFEGVPNVLIEAMAIGIPCISTDCEPGGARMLIENEKNGMLVRVGSSVQIAEAIDRIIQDTELANRISREAMKIRNQLDSRVVCKYWETYLQQIVNKRLAF